MKESDDNLDSQNQKSENYEKILKMVIIGDSNVGKTKICCKYLYNEFTNDTKSTVGVDLFSKSMLVNDIKIKLNIWDTAGQERYHSVTTAYYKGSNGCFIVYDITDKNSFDNVEKWYEEVKKIADKDILIILIGNKNDLENEREVTIEMGKKKAENLKCPFFETSALTNYQIDVAFQEITQEILNKLQNEEENDSAELIGDDKNMVNININEEIEQQEKKGCCL